MTVGSGEQRNAQEKEEDVNKRNRQASKLANKQVC